MLQGLQVWPNETKMISLYIVDGRIKSTFAHRQFLSTISYMRQQTVYSIEAKKRSKSFSIEDFSFFCCFWFQPCPFTFHTFIGSFTRTNSHFQIDNIVHIEIQNFILNGSNLILQLPHPMHALFPVLFLSFHLMTRLLCMFQYIFEWNSDMFTSNWNWK